MVILVAQFILANFCFAQGLTPNDPFYYRQWYLSRLNMPDIWVQNLKHKNTIIAVIDSGIDISHPDLHDNVWVNQAEIDGDGIDNDKNGYIDDINGWDFIADDNNPAPDYALDCLETNSCEKEAIYHGTLVAGVAAAIGNNTIGIAGIAWQSTKIMPLRVLDEYGTGTIPDVVEAINYAIDKKADILNMSFVSIPYDGDFANAINRAYNAGLIIVASAGNEEFIWEIREKQHDVVQIAYPINLDLEKRYPVCYDGNTGANMVIGVGATDEDDKLAYYSNYGSSCLDIVAPGSNFYGLQVVNPAVPGLSEFYGGDYSGTSLAAPVVSGIAALIKSTYPELTNIEIRDFILKNTRNIDSQNLTMKGKIGKGMIDPLKIFNVIKSLSASNQLIKGASSTVYYLADNGKRYVFPDEKVYVNWFGTFKDIKIVDDSVLASLPLAGLVTYRPGSLLKIQSDPRVYVVAIGAKLRWIKDVNFLTRYYGPYWQTQVNDISESFFISYSVGEPLETVYNFDPFAEQLNAPTIESTMSLK
ncbi:MAG: S8 family peptidase [Candidatus Parcubacteria bacterium]|nr:S8 family peptidase [Candidatus Parcubacteria bacterium]